MGPPRYKYYTLETKYKQSGSVRTEKRCSSFPLKLKITGIRCDRRIDIFLPRVVHFFPRYRSIRKKGLPEREGGGELYYIDITR